MTPESPADEVILIEEQIETEPGRATPSPRTTGLRIAGLVAGSLGLSLAAATVARRVAAGRLGTRQGARARRGGALVSVQPRVAVFAPSVTIALPFSDVRGAPPFGRPRRDGRRQAVLRWQATAGQARARGRRMGRRPALRRRFAR